jgi:hypothetical protein
MVNAISPGVIETPISAEMSEQMKSFLMSSFEYKRHQRHIYRRISIAGENQIR